MKNPKVSQARPASLGSNIAAAIEGLNELNLAENTVIVAFLKLVKKVYVSGISHVRGGVDSITFMSDTGRGSDPERQGVDHIGRTSGNIFDHCYQAIGAQPRRGLKRCYEAS